jgi:hypothetical protein
MKLRFQPIQLITLAFFFSLLVIGSCKKEKSQSASDEEQEVTASQVSSEADAQAELVFNGVFDDAMGVNDEVGIGGTGVFGRINACPTVVVVRLNAPNLFPVKIILDYGAGGCTGPDGHFRKGKVISVYSNRLLIPGATDSVTFDGFYIDSIKVEGLLRIQNTGTGPVTSPTTRQFTTDVVNGKLTKPSGNYVHWNSHKVITQAEGLSTPNIPLDDIFRIEGSARGQVLRGNLLVAWESSITEPLYKRFTCRWIVRGKIRTVRINSPANSPWIAVLDFGAGTCDNQAIVTINGIPHQITLP